ncbi:MAG: CYTH domain-containing protein [Bacteroidales bacterium]|nr:CYTH domain-containing protein [Bacteroidales bacterium]
MAVEIERKFLVCGDYKSSARESSHIVQGYLNMDKDRTVRVRVRDDKGYMTVKGPTNGVSRYEWEKEIPRDEAAGLLALCPAVIDKTRHLVDYGGHTFEVDEFHGDNAGLTVAEIELSSEDELFEKPSWLGEEVSHDRRYYNSQLLLHPFKEW